jgi:hypothetical protein
MKTGQTTHETPLRPIVLWIGAAAAMSSGVALVVAILTERPLWLAATFVFVPGLIAFTARTHPPGLDPRVFRLFQPFSPLNSAASRQRTASD